MSSRTPACEDVGMISRRLDELQREAVGCTCQRDLESGVLNHAADCPFGPGLPPATPPVVPFQTCGCAPDISHRQDCALRPVKLTPPRWVFALLADHRRAVADAIEDQLNCDKPGCNQAIAK